jgi:hypothetical protein
MSLLLKVACIYYMTDILLAEEGTIVFESRFSFSFLHQCAPHSGVRLVELLSTVSADLSSSAHLS